MNFFQNLQDRNKLENNTTAKLPWNENLQNTDHLEPVKMKVNSKKVILTNHYPDQEMLTNEAEDIEQREMDSI